MSFSREVKDEISGIFSKARHCRIAEIAALFSVCGRVVWEDDGEKQKLALKFTTENLTVAKKYFILMKKAFDVSLDLSVRSSRGGRKNIQIEATISSQQEVKAFCKALKWLDENGQWVLENHLIHKKLIVQNCCKRAFIRGMFLAAGSITDPNCGYHFELITQNARHAEELVCILSSFDVGAKVVKRKKNDIVYVKEGSQIVDLLNIMESHVALMKFENVRILKEVRNSINRQVNCEAANIKKTVSAASKQKEDICYIRDEMGFGVLSEGLAKVAKLRVEYPDASLKELGEMLEPPISKSGVNHRLRKISEIAADLRQHKEENQ